MTGCSKNHHRISIAEIDARSGGRRRYPCIGSESGQAVIGGVFLIKPYLVVVGPPRGDGNTIHNRGFGEYCPRCIDQSRSGLLSGANPDVNCGYEVDRTISGTKGRRADPGCWLIPWLRREYPINSRRKDCIGPKALHHRRFQFFSWVTQGSLTNRSEELFIPDQRYRRWHQFRVSR